MVAKPSGLPVHRSAMVNERRTLIRIAKRQFGASVAPVHRLDRATSGCLLLSRDAATTARLQAAMARGTKRYLAFVRGAVRDFDEMHVTTPVKDERKGLQSAESYIRPVGTSQDPRCSLLLVRPITGRNHQVRRHCRDLHHPVIGDGQHGDTRVNRWWREHYAMPRLGLHCLSMSLETDEDGVVDATCPVPPDLMAVFEQMPWFDHAVREVPEMLSPAAHGRDAES
ncbi:MAG: pseudouridine synthase [Myxococcota bacterium]